MYFSGLAKIFALRIILTLARKKYYFILFGGRSWSLANKKRGNLDFWAPGILGKVVK